MLGPVFTASSVGKNVRLRRILGNGTGRGVVFAMDHGVEHGPRDFPPQHLDPRVILSKVVDAGVNAVMVKRGVARLTWDVWGGRTSLVLKVTGKTELRPEAERNLQSPTAEVEDAVALDADAVAYTVYWGSQYEDQMLRTFREVAGSCEVYGLPVLMLAYPRGPTIKSRTDVEIVRYASRAGAEVGADLIKTHYTGSRETFSEVVKACPVPVMLSGGEKAETPRDFFQVVKNVMDAGAAGAVVGRNVFQSEDPVSMMKAILKIVHEGASVDDAEKTIKKQ